MVGRDVVLLDEMRTVAALLMAMMAQDKGDKAPDFTLKNQDGKEIKLSSLAGKSSVLLSFYPKDDTGG